MWGRRPLPRSQNLGEGAGSMKPLGTLLANGGFLGIPSRLPEGGTWGLEPQQSQPGA